MPPKRNEAAAASAPTVNTGVSFQPPLVAAIKGCSGAVAALIKSVEPSLERDDKKQLVTCAFGPSPTDEATISVPTAWPIYVGKLVAFLPCGGFIADTRTTTARLVDEGTLGWENASPGPVFLSDKQFLIGDDVPAVRPLKAREVKLDAMGNEVLNDIVEALYISKVKVSKEEKAALKKEKARAKAKAKGEVYVEDGEEVEDGVELKDPSKKDVKAAKGRAAEKRKKGERKEGDGATDDELVAFGFNA